jgi:hypothetical protein
MTGQVLLVGRFPESSPLRRSVTDCEVLAVHDNGFDLDNEEQGTQVMLCTPSRPWSQIWSELRHFY